MYLATSVGREDKLRFNAHRVFDPNTIISSLSQMAIVKFVYVNDWKLIDVKSEIIELDMDETCGIFIFEKR